MLETLGREGLSEEIRIIIHSIDQRHDDLLRFDHIADEEVPPLHVLHAIVVLRVVRRVAGALTIRAERGCARLRSPKPGAEYM